MTTANWAGNVAFTGTRVHHPESVEELRQIVASNSRIRAIGSGHSFSRVIEPAGDLVRLDRLPDRVEIDRSSRTATVAAGMSYGAVARCLQRDGFALANLASLPHVSIAGACATGTHGSGDGHGALATAVVGLRLVGPDGELIELHRDADGETFCGAVVALGALGIVTELTLEVEPAYEVAQLVRVGVPLDEVVERFDDVAGAADSVSVFTDWARDYATVWLKHRTDRRPGIWLGGSEAPEALHPVPGLSPKTCTPQFGRVGPWHERLPHFDTTDLGVADELQSEFFIPRAAATLAFAELRNLAAALAPVLRIVEIRTVRADDLWLSPAYERDSATLHFTWTSDSDAVASVLAAVERSLLPLAPRPHWGKLTLLSPATIHAAYARADDFQSLLSTYDPGRKFGNAFVDELFSPHSTVSQKCVSPLDEDIHALSESDFQSGE